MTSCTPRAVVAVHGGTLCRRAALFNAPLFTILLACNSGRLLLWVALG